MRPVILASLLALFGCKGAAARDSGPHPTIARVKPGALAAVARDALCVTRGDIKAVDGALHVTSAVTRAVVPGSSGEAARLRFTYLGPSDEESKLASGQVRHQIGVKLRAADGCNVVYVMWRVEPRPFIEVSVKRNPGKRTHAECGASGYTKVKPVRTDALPAFQEGATHLLEAAIDGDTLVAKVDGVVVWEGDLDPLARELDGPAGFRSDNMTYDAVLEAARAAGPQASSPGCPGSGADD